MVELSAQRAAVVAAAKEQLRLHPSVKVSIHVSD
jgi:hypothetical protein